MVNSHLRGWAAQALNSLLPQYCLLCGLPSGQSLPLCAPCREELPENPHACRCCALPLASAAATECGACLQRPPAFDRVVAPFLYDPQIALLIQRWKYQPLPRLGATVARLWCASIPDPPPVDVITTVPLHWRKLLRRGFNQSAQLAERIHSLHPELNGIALSNALLRRRRATAVQAGLNARARQRNLRGAFTLLKRCDNLRVAVVDDVMTTGATANELARCLKAGGAREVQLWCLARTPTPSD